MLTEFKTLHPHDTLQQAVEHILAGTQQDFPVLEEGRTVGILTRSDLLAALSRHSEASRVNAVMRRDFEMVHPGDMLEAASVRLQACGCPVFPVIQDGQLVGLLSMENIGEFLMIRSALELHSLRTKALRN
jgi:predicted transcriptional regulator